MNASGYFSGGSTVKTVGKVFGGSGSFVIVRRRVNLDVIWQRLLTVNPYKPPIESEQVSEDWTDGQRQLFLLASLPAVFLPLSYLVVVGGAVLPFVPEFLRNISATVGFAGLVGTAIQLPVYLVWAMISPELRIKHKVIWAVILCVINMFGIPMFLYAKYRRQTVTMWSPKGA